MRWLPLLVLLAIGCQSPEPKLPAPQPSSEAAGSLNTYPPDAPFPVPAPISSDTVITAHVEAIGALVFPRYTASLFGNGTVRLSAESDTTVEYRVPRRDVGALVSAFVEGGFFDLDDRYVPPDSAWFSIHSTTVTLSASLNGRWKRVVSEEKAGPVVLDSLTRRFFRVSRVDSVIAAARDSLFQPTEPVEEEPFWEWPTPSNPRSQPTPGFTALPLSTRSAYVASSKRFAARRG